MMMKQITYLVIGFLLLAACTEHRPGNEVIVIDNEDEKTGEETTEKYKGVKVFQGTIPCADCSGIEQQLLLKGDSSGIYRLKETYKNATEDGDSELTSSGEWRRMKQGGGYIYYLSEKNLRDSVRIMRYRIQGERITLLGTSNGDSIRSSANYSLKLSSKKD